MVHFEDELKKYKGTMNSFHAPMAVVTITVATIGFNNGKITEKNVLTGVAPSINAASSSSLGTFFIIAVS